MDKVQLRKRNFEGTRKRACSESPIAYALLTPERDRHTARVADRLGIARGTRSNRRKRYPASQETVAEMRRFLNNRVTETAAAATVASGYSDGDYLLLHSSRRSDAVLLEALVVDRP